MNHRWLRTGEERTPRISFGADYNPDQWPREVWAEDVRLMQEAGVDVVSVAIFSWAKIQPAPDQWDFAWLDEVLDLLHAGGIGVDLATATASPPPWLTLAHPEILPVTADGRILSPGGRQHWRPTSAVFRAHALGLVERIAERYRDHPAIVAWHVSNELGCHNAWDHSEDATRAFRTWLEHRYTGIDGLNAAWGTAFWSQRYSSFEEVLTPRLVAALPNPTQRLDFLRFSSDALKEYLVAEREVLRRITPDIPVTTNFMIMEGKNHAAYDDWAREVDFVSNDHYRFAGEQSFDELAFSAALTSGVAQGSPWFLMEHSTSAVNWQPVNQPKQPGEMARDALTHVAYGADAVCYFQWRQSVAGAEKFHSAMLPHAGEDSQLFRDVVQLGERLRRLDDVAGSRREAAPVAVLFDWDSWWASELESHPSTLLRYRREALDWWRALADAGVRADVITPGTDLTPYDVVVAPMLYLVSGRTSRELTGYVEGGGNLITTYFSGIADENDHVVASGYPGALRDLLGIRVEEFHPLLEEEHVLLEGDLRGSLWNEGIQLRSPETRVVRRYATGPHAGEPAVTRRAAGAGSASYVSTRLRGGDLLDVVAELLEAAGVASELPSEMVGAVFHSRRTIDGSGFDFYINRTDRRVPLPSDEPDLFEQRAVPPRGVAVVRRIGSPLR
ncbi:beta-galactosidase [Rathayibacter sp. AY1E1]|uniref:beta-galactosidase n=1 Tax=Rathayibacter sp. AY1E1 TaxID=2080549 RepID=UPI000CE8F017|nr:beta-galactosidase [Rathayibacter sp. AY1E1]PPH55836.1 beta-galactosidase [Rathayibacter sp. AY1E1]